MERAACQWSYETLIDRMPPLLSSFPLSLCISLFPLSLHPFHTLYPCARVRRVEPRGQRASTH